MESYRPKTALASAADHLLRVLLAWAAGLDVRAYNVLHHNFIAAKAGTPQLLLIQKNG